MEFLWLWGVESADARTGMAVNHTPILLYGEDQSLQSIKKRKNYTYIMHFSQFLVKPNYSVTNILNYSNSIRLYT